MPQEIILWGVGLTQSDADLMSLYSGWSKKLELVEVINPSEEVARAAQRLFGCPVRHFTDIEDWAARADQSR